MPMNIPLRRVAEWLQSETNSNAIVTGWSVDTRTIRPGDLFFALRGPNQDGNEYVAQAFEKGASAAIVDRDVAGAGEILRVEDSLVALHSLASRARQEWGGDVVAVTGSAGKTTTKEMIAEMLSTAMPVTRSQGNLNNHVGLPLSLLRLDPNARAAVVEIGMNHAGEIRDLAAIAKPQVGVVTNVGYAHIEFFESIDGIALAKRELIDSLPPDGIAVLNIDDPRVRNFGDMHPGRVVRFGFSESADVRAEDVVFRADGTRFRVRETTFDTALQGRHAVLNILAGLAVADVYGIAPSRL